MTDQLKGIECPVCSVYHQIDLPDVTQFPPNYAIFEILTQQNLLRSDLNTGLPTDMCEACTTSPVTMVCIDCQPGSQIKFCKLCEEKEHNREFEPVRRHRRYPKGQVPKHTMAIFCSRHRNNKAALFSESLNEFACNEACTNEPEWYIRSTQFEPISDAVKRLRAQAQGLIKKSRKVVSRLAEMKTMISQEINALGPTAINVKANILTIFTELLDIIQQRRENLVTLVEEEVIISYYYKYELYSSVQ